MQVSALLLLEEFYDVADTVLMAVLLKGLVLENLLFVEFNAHAFIEFWAEELDNLLHHIAAIFDWHHQRAVVLLEGLVPLHHTIQKGLRRRTHHSVLVAAHEGYYLGSVATPAVLLAEQDTVSSGNIPIEPDHMVKSLLFGDVLNNR